MSATYLPHRVAPLRLARDGVRMLGEVPADRLPRFAAGVDTVLEPVQAELDFHLDEERRICVTGSLKVRVSLTCQRCLGQLTQELECVLHLALVKDEQELSALPSSYDGVVVPREPTALAGLLEDDLILAIPAVPQHRAEACEVPRTPGCEADAGSQGAEENPFAALRKLKDNK